LPWLLAFAQAAGAAACATATPACTEWLTVAGGSGRLLAYRSHALDERNERIVRALVVIHGQTRNADGYFRYAMEAATRAGALDDTLVVSLRFAASDGRRCHDALAPGEWNWVCYGAASWRNGAAPVNDAAVTSYAVADALLARLARRDAFPNLRAIVMAGHSAGGQYTGRYAMMNGVPDRAGVTTTYVVANPSSYTYLDTLRPAATAWALPPDEGSRPDTAALFTPFDAAAACPGFDNWPYGLRNRAGYGAALTAETIGRQLAARSVTYLLGERDVLPVSGFDATCAAMAQGPTRVARGVAFGRYVNALHGARHRTVIVPGCAHDGRCMLTAVSARALLFP